MPSDAFAEARAGDEGDDAHWRRQASGTTARHICLDQMAIPPDLSLVLRWVETERGLGYLAMRWSAVVSDARAKPLMPFGGLNTALRVEQLRRLVQGLGYGGRIATELSELLINADAALVTREQRRGRGASP